VQKEFETAVIKLNIPFAAFGDADGVGARSYAEQCRALVTQPGIELRITHDFLALDDLLTVLESNTINAFFYEQAAGRGLSSAIDWALAVDRPIAISESDLFRHVSSARPSIWIEHSSLKEIIQQGTGPLLPYKKEWTAENLCWDYERIVKSAIATFTARSEIDRSVDTAVYHIKAAVSKTPAGRLIRKVRSMRNQPRSRDKRMVEGVSGVAVRPGAINTADYGKLLVSETAFNRILDDSAREQYKDVISLLFQLCPDEMSRKLPEANIQQAFVFETVRRLSHGFDKPKILSVGCYEDTAFVGLERMGFAPEGIDPVLNYDLHTFITKPGMGDARFDVVFSTSVIEHVYDDETFVREMADLLNPGGFIVVTCDYKQDYKNGDRVPIPDFRFYTEYDLRERLLSKMSGCRLYGPSDWDCPRPDFWFENLNYPFATLVVQKQTGVAVL